MIEYTKARKSKRAFGIASGDMEPGGLGVTYWSLCLWWWNVSWVRGIEEFMEAADEAAKEE